MVILPFASSFHCVLGIFRPKSMKYAGSGGTKRYWSKNVTCFMVQLMQNVILCTGLCHFLKVHCWTHTPPHYKPTIQQFQTRRLNECFIVKCKGYKYKYKYTNTSESAGITCVLCSTNPIYVPRRRADATLMEISIADAHLDGKVQSTL